MLEYETQPVIPLKSNLLCNLSEALVSRGASEHTVLHKDDASSPPLSESFSSPCTDNGEVDEFLFLIHRRSSAPSGLISRISWRSRSRRAVIP